eukprot:TRINITY_DN16685_c0_g1_i4.p2 TRINITY_DN16685_c0_g1~~TRINITY_DN16685_c0_g1_i4.p2  ORF type:complete len:304 (-),score=32.95 TRINITY_DN16685_c0_g1_i4:169-966(-)
MWGTLNLNSPNSLDSSLRAELPCLFQETIQRGGILPVPNIWGLLAQISKVDELVLGVWKSMDSTLIFAQENHFNKEKVIQENFKQLLSIVFLREGADLLWDKATVRNQVQNILQSYFNYKNEVTNDQICFEVPFDLVEQVITEFSAWSMGEKVFGSIVSFLASSRVSCSKEVWTQIVNQKLLRNLPKKQEYFWEVEGSYNFNLAQTQRNFGIIDDQVLKRAIEGQVGIVMCLLQNFVNLNGKEYVRNWIVGKFGDELGKLVYQDI